MATTYYGNVSSGQLHLQPGYPRRVRTGTEWSYDWRYWCHQNVATDGGAAIPAADAPMPSIPGVVGCASYLLTKVEITPHTAPNLVWVDLTYTFGGVAKQSIHKAGDVVRGAQKTTREVDKDTALASGIISKAQYDALSDSDKTVMVVCVEYTYTYYDGAFPWTEASVLQYLCEMGKKPTDTTTMPGMTAVADYTKWLCMGQTIRADGNLTEVSTTYGFDRSGWAGVAIVT